jgi:hypothetical protein
MSNAPNSFKTDRTISSDGYPPIPKFDPRKNYDLASRDPGEEDDAFAIAMCYLDDLPPGVQDHQADKVWEQLTVLAKDSGEDSSVRRAFVEYLKRRGWPHDHKAVAQHCKSGERRAQEAEREFDLQFAFRKVGTEEVVIGYPIVEGLLGQGQPGSLAGPFKGFKTGLALAMGVHIANGKPFLGLKVPHALRVGGLFGESAPDALVAAAKRIADAIGGSLDGLDLFTRVPSFGKKKTRDDLAFLARRNDWGVAIIDPLYKALGGRVDVSNLYSSASRLRAVTDALVEWECTPLFVHHASRGLLPGRPMELGDLLGAGTSEFFRSWALLNRATPFDPARPGRHDLILDYGNCLGATGRLLLNIDEGLGATPWSIEVRPAGEGEAKGKTSRTSPTHRILDALATLSTKYRGRVPRTKLGQAAKVTGGNLTAALSRLSSEGRIVLETEDYEYQGKPAARQFVRAAAP